MINKVFLNIRHRLSEQLRWLSWYLIIYIVLMFLLYLSLIQTSLISESSGSFVYRLWGLLLFQFAVSMRFKEDFNFWLILANTRTQILQSFIGSGIILSFLISCLILLEKLCIDLLNVALSYHNVTDPFHFFSPYTTGNFFLQFMFFFIVSVFFSMFSVTIGSLFYRYGKRFMIGFWLVILSILILVLPFLSLTFYGRDNLYLFITKIGEFLSNFKLFTGLLYFLALTLIFTLTAFLNLKKLSQN